MKILGVDYGESKIGLAITEGEIAEPLGVREIGNCPPAGGLGIGRICQEQGVKKIVIGISEGKMAEKTRKFGEELEKVLKIPVEFWDETLTSKEAIVKMIEAGKPRRERKSVEHAVAAALTLQDYLDNKI